MVASSITTLALGGSAAAFALPAAIAETSPEPGGTEWGVPMVLGGATTVAGGLTLLLAGLADPAAHADAGRARVAAGGMVVSLGAGMGVAGLSAMALGTEDGDAPAMFVTGLATSAIGVPFVAWGASTWGEDRDGAYASTGRVATGLVLAGAGIVVTAGGVLLAASSDDVASWERAPSPGSSPGPSRGSMAAVLSVPVLVLGSAGLGVGIPLIAAGADVVDERHAVPDVSVGPASIQARWTLR